MTKMNPAFTTFVLVTVLSLVLAGCNLPQPGVNQGTQAETQVSDLAEFILESTLTAPQPTPSPSPSPSPSPTPVPTYPALLPLLLRLPVLPGHDWQVLPLELDASQAEMNFTMTIFAPYLQAAPGNPADKFNRVIEVIVAEEKARFQWNEGETPFEGTEAFVWLKYIVPSQAGWKPSRSAYLVFDRPAAVGGDRAMTAGGDEVLSVLFEIYAYLGGLRPEVHHRVVNYDITEGKLLELTDLFMPESAYLEAIANFCIQELEKRKEVLIEEYQKNAGPAAENYRVWNVTPDGLLITFEENQVATGAAGPQQVLVPYAALKEVLDPEGPFRDFTK